LSGGYQAPLKDIKSRISYRAYQSEEGSVHLVVLGSFLKENHLQNPH